jgi:hypothetical protein
MQGRIQCRTNLLRKNVVDMALCEVCNPEDELAHHIILGCSFAKAFWGSIGVHQLPDTISDIHSTFVALC